MRIKAKDPVREEFAGCSTSSNYYETKGHAIHAFDSVLKEFNLKLDDEHCMILAGDEGRTYWDVCTDKLECSEVVGQAVFTWYRMFSGRYEFIGYLA